MVELNFEECVKAEDAKRMNEHIMSEMKALKVVSKENNKRFIEIDGKFSVNAKMLASKVSTKELRDLKVQIDQLPTIPEIREWKKSLQDDIDNFTADNNKFKRDFER
jgi:hypothetical protein